MRIEHEILNVAVDDDLPTILSIASERGWLVVGVLTRYQAPATVPPTATVGLRASERDYVKLLMRRALSDDGTRILWPAMEPAPAPTIRYTDIT